MRPLSQQVDTVELAQPATRRRHGDDLKARVLAECAAPGASVTAIALSHGLNVSGWPSPNLVQQHGATFIAETATGADLPQLVKDEFDALLQCGILAHGFLRLRGDCGHD